MTHPEELLAAYVDGTLDERAAAAVEAHLASCHACREEVGLAARGRAALRALPDVSPPASARAVSPLPASAEGARRTKGRPSRPAPRDTLVRLGMGVAAAAVLFLAFVWVGSQPPRDTPDAARPAAGEAGGGGQEPVPAPSFFPAGSDRQSVGDYASSLAARLRNGPGALPDARSRPPRGEELACLRRGAGLGARLQTIRIVRSRFQGTPAYIGAFAEDNPPRLEVFVVARADCRVLFSVRRPL